jgi:hypothetical protein
MKALMKTLLITLSCLLISTQLFASCVQWPSDVFQPIPNPKTHQIAPDYGIYWFKNVGGKEQAMREFIPPYMAHQFSNGKINRLPKGVSLDKARDAYMKELEEKGFFDPNKPTLIFIHGDQPTMVAKHKRIDFCYSYMLTNGKMLATINTRGGWKNWNVGIFYWTQFADDVQGKGLGNFVKAITYPEMKIYSSENNAGMRWAYLDKQGKSAFCYHGKNHCIKLPSNASGHPDSVSQLAYFAYINAFPKCYDKSIRVTGQSLGTQVAIQLVSKIVKNHHIPRPNELVLLDPYFTPGLHHINLGPDHGSVGTFNFNTMRHVLLNDDKLGFAIYRTTKLSEWPTGDENKPLENISAYLRICPAYLKNANQKQVKVFEHISCGYIYFHSKQFPAPKNFVTASSTPEDILRLMGTKRYCTINNFNQGCKYVSNRPIHCKLEGRFFKIR